MQYIVIESRWGWDVESFGETLGEFYGVRFFGAAAEQRAREYAAWKQADVEAGRAAREG